MSNSRGPYKVRKFVDPLERLPHKKRPTSSILEPRTYTYSDLSKEEKELANSSVVMVFQLFRALIEKRRTPQPNVILGHHCGFLLVFVALMRNTVISEINRFE
jgi:hypothetical protein